VDRRRPFRKRLVIALLFLVVGVVAGFLCWFLTLPPDPLYKGHRLSWWVEHSQDPMAHLFNANSIREIGAPAIRWLTYKAEHGRIPRRSIPTSATGQFLRKCSDLFRRAFHIIDDEYDERKEALFYLGRLGPDAAPAIPALERILISETPINSGLPAMDGIVFSNDYSTLAADILITIGPQARATTLKLFTEGSATVRRRLISSLDPTLRSDLLFEYLALSCRDPDLENRKQAFLVIKRLSEHAPDTVETLFPIALPLLAEETTPPREGLVDWLGSLGERATPAIPHLLPLFDDPSPAVRSSTVYALTTIDPTGKFIIPHARTLLESSDPQRREIGRRILYRVGVEPPE
jgi:hypothetical protein